MRIYMKEFTCQTCAPVPAVPCTRLEAMAMQPLHPSPLEPFHPNLPCPVLMMSLALQLTFDYVIRVIYTKFIN